MESKTKKAIEKYRVELTGNRWVGFRECPECFEQIKQEATERYYLLRNIKKFEGSLCKSCNKKGSKNPFAGKVHTKKTKNLQSKNRKGKACGENNAMADAENRNKVSVALKEKYDSGELDFLKDIQRETAIKNQALGKLKTAPISAVEKELKTLFESKGFTVTPQYRIGSLLYDLYIKELNATIEYNGDYWHCNPTKYNRDYLHTKKQMYAYQIWERDQKKKEISEAHNHKHFIIWENDYKFNKEKEVQKILNEK